MRTIQRIAYIAMGFFLVMTTSCDDTPRHSSENTTTNDTTANGDGTAMSNNTYAGPSFGSASSHDERYCGYIKDALNQIDRARWYATQASNRGDTISLNANLRTINELSNDISGWRSRMENPNAC